MTIWNVSKDSPAQQIWQKAWGAGLLVNLSIQNPVYLAYGTPGVNASSDTLPAGATMAVNGLQDIYASTLDPTITVPVQAMPGVTSWTPPPPVIVSAVGSASGSEAVDFYTFTEAGRIWGVMLSYAVVTDSGYSGGPILAVCEVADNQGLVLAVARIAVPDASAGAVSNQAVSFPGTPVPAGTVIVLDTENSVPAGATQAASAVVYYSVP